MYQSLCVSDPDSESLYMRGSIACGRALLVGLLLLLHVYMLRDDWEFLLYPAHWHGACNSWGHGSQPPPQTQTVIWGRATYLAHQGWRRGEECYTIVLQTQVLVHVHTTWAVPWPQFKHIPDQHKETHSISKDNRSVTLTGVLSPPFSHSRRSLLCQSRQGLLFALQGNHQSQLLSLCHFHPTKSGIFRPSKIDDD